MTIITPAHNKNFIIQYENSLKEEINFVLKKIYSIFKDLEKNRKEEKLKRENAKIIEEIKNTCKKISDFLSDNNILITEYFDFLRIEYLINESIELNENRSYELVLSLLKEFNNITSLKYDLIHKNNLKDISSSKYDLIHKNNLKDIKKEFKKEYDKFHNYLFEIRDEFYLIINKDSERPVFEYLKLKEADYKNLNEYDQIHKFFNEYVLEKYNFTKCLMEESDEDEKGMVYHFFIKEDINPVEFSELSLKINIDLNHLCKMRNLNVFLKTLINIVRE